jgi:hypothetical protein
VPEFGAKRNPEILVTALLVPIVATIALDWLLVTTNGKTADPLGVFVASLTCKVMPLVDGIVTVVVHVTDPLQVKRTVSPSCVDVAAMAELTAAAEQSEGPTVTTAAVAAIPRSRTIISKIRGFKERKCFGIACTFI